MKKIFFITVLFVVLGIFLPGLVQARTNQPPPENLWVVDPEVTFVGKNAARAGQLFDWSLQNYNWICVSRTAAGACTNDKNPLQEFVFMYTAPLALLIGLIILIRTRAKPFSSVLFLKKLGILITGIVSAYILLIGIYQLADLMQSLSLAPTPLKHCPPTCLSQRDLLYVGWSPDRFVGLRLMGDANRESAWTSLMLIKLTSLTYYVIAGALALRKIMLWFMLLVSPFLVLLFFFQSVRNVGKLLLAEYLLWIFYAPVLAMMLSLVSFFWYHGIPSYQTPVFSPDNFFFPTSINILLGGPGQHITPTNSLNLPGTFLLYVVSLATLMVIIILPLIILRIGIDYLISYQRPQPRKTVALVL